MTHSDTSKSELYTLEHVVSFIDFCRDIDPDLIRNVVLASGAFDLLHVGHLLYLKDAKQYGDRLIVAINSDESIRRYKGSNRPIVPQYERAYMLTQLRMVDDVVIFDEDDASAVIRAVRPAYFAKGRDRNIGEITEKAATDEVGTKIIFVGELKTRSTSKLIEKLEQ